MVPAWNPSHRPSRASYTAVALARGLSQSVAAMSAAFARLRLRRQRDERLHRRHGRHRCARVRLTFTGDNGATAVRKLVLTPQGFRSEEPLPTGLPIFGYGAYRHYQDEFRRWRSELPVISLFRTDNLFSNTCIRTSDGLHALGVGDFAGPFWSLPLVA
jgi:hypothetical protein